jgi:hypothetical protein
MALIGGMQAAGQAEAAGAYQRAIVLNEATVRERNAKAAEADAEVAKVNAQRAGLITQENARDQDFAARDEIGGVIADQGAKGLTGASPARQVSALRMLAGRDRTRLVEEGGAQTREFRAQRAAFLTEAADQRTGAAGARADAGMITANAKSDAFQSRLSGVAGAIQGFTGAGEFLLDGKSRAKASSDFDRVFRRKRGGY